MVAIIGRKIPTGGYNIQPQNGIGNVFAAMAKPFLNTLDNDLKRAKLDESDREAGSIAGIQAAIDAARGGSDVDVYDLVKHGVAGSRKMGDIADILPLIYGNTRGAADRSTTNALVGAGKGYGSTYHGVQDDFANKRTMQSMADRAATDRAVRVKGMDPVNIMVDGVPQIAPLAEARGARPVLNLTQEQGAFAANNVQRINEMSPTEKSFISAEPSNKTPYTYVTPDGRSGTTVDSMTDAQSGEKLPQGVQIKRLEGESADNLGGNTLVNKITDRRVATRQAQSAITELESSLAAPNADAAIGWIGTTAGFFNNARSQLEAATRIAGGLTAQQEVQANPTIAAAADNAVSRVMNDPKYAGLAKQLGVQHAVLKSQIVDLAYMIAKANDPGGRMSDQDIARASEIIGSTLMDPSAARVVLRQLSSRLDANQRIWEEEFARTRGGQPSQAPAESGAVEEYVRGPDGKLVRGR